MSSIEGNDQIQVDDFSRLSPPFPHPPLPSPRLVLLLFPFLVLSVQSTFLSALLQAPIALAVLLTTFKISAPSLATAKCVCGDSVVSADFALERILTEKMAMASDRLRKWQWRLTASIIARKKF
eukprot:g63197.t1